MRTTLLLPLFLLILLGFSLQQTLIAQPPSVVSENGLQLNETKSLNERTPLSDRILDGASAFLDRKLAEAAQPRMTRWQEVFSSPQPQQMQQLDELRQLLGQITGSIDKRVAPILSTPFDSKATIHLTETVTAKPIQWSVFENYTASGLCISKSDHQPSINLLWLPDTIPEKIQDQTTNKIPLATTTIQHAVQLAEAGARIFILYPISNLIERRGNRIDLTDREYVYRALFVLGRHPIGIESQSVFALIDWLMLENTTQVPAIGIIGEGDGGLPALIATAIDQRLSVCLVRGDFGNRAAIWTQPISRNLFDFLTDFDDAQLACLIAPRKLIIDVSLSTSYTVDSPGAAPGIRRSPTRAMAEEQLFAATQITGTNTDWITITDSQQESTQLLAEQASLTLPSIDNISSHQATELGFPAHFRQQQLRHIESLSDHWIASLRVIRQNWIDALDTTSVENYQRSLAPHRERFENEVIGHFNDDRLPADAKSRLWKKTDKWTGWELEVDVFPGVPAGGILLVPNDVEPAKPRPAVVCVHGLEGIPLDTIDGDHPAYHDFAAKICEHGFVVFCPQQLYLGRDRFRVLQRKANPLGKTLFSLMIPQHRQMVDLLKTLPYVDSDRIAFYGLSYGGKSAMRIPAVVEDYCAVICSGDFNEWVLKNSSIRDNFSYVWTPEYEIFEFDLASTFNYAEMAALICPRPFMVERGHFDGVAVDPWVAFEYAKVRHLYAARLRIPEKTEIEWFVGPHTINGQGTFNFLRKHLNNK